MKCKICGSTMTEENNLSEDIIEDIYNQVDMCGVESLSENKQVFYIGETVCNDCI